MVNCTIIDIVNCCTYLSQHENQLEYTRTHTQREIKVKIKWNAKAQSIKPRRWWNWGANRHQSLQNFRHRYLALRIRNGSELDWKHWDFSPTTGTINLVNVHKWLNGETRKKMSKNTKMIDKILWKAHKYL